MSNRNGKGPQNKGLMTGKGNGVCKGTGSTGQPVHEQQEQLLQQQQIPSPACQGPKGCGTGKHSGAGRCEGRAKRGQRP